MNLDAYIGIGTIILESDIEVDECLLEEKYEGSILEYLYDILADGVRVDKTTYESEEIVIYLDDTVRGADWGPVILDIDMCFDIEEKIARLASILNKHKIKYESIGFILMPRFSH